MILVDSNVLLDLFTNDPAWYDWSARALSQCAETDTLAVNPVIYSEVSVGFERIEELDLCLPETLFKRLPLPWEAGFLAGKVFVRYRRAGGLRHSPLPDFFIGAHAAVSGLRLITRDPKPYRTYFPTLELIAP
ncbi:MAG TPA: type II toxin-antitoxin system VapC family toxin [Spirochaetota bacterium]|nr:type II toxin-antitoxin system VapC family toxin [Spirochaetota bacterium]HPN82881.1 type II toxin-antitoxin system VapC family toxin [Spirochaetota bacterium]